jgi:hypothetical protein
VRAGLLPRSDSDHPGDARLEREDECRAVAEIAGDSGFYARVLDLLIRDAAALGGCST